MDVSNDLKKRYVAFLLIVDVSNDIKSLVGLSGPKFLWQFKS